MPYLHRCLQEPMTLETMPITSSNLMKLTRKAYERLEQLAEVLMPLDAFEVPQLPPSPLLPGWC